jgi:hypothetical protein
MKRCVVRVVVEVHPPGVGVDEDDVGLCLVAVEALGYGFDSAL